MFDVGFAELFLLALIGLLVLGPERLPRVAQKIGSVLRQARQSWNVMKRTIEAEMAQSGLDDSVKKAQENLRDISSKVSDLPAALQNAAAGTGSAAQAGAGESAEAAETPANPDDTTSPDDTTETGATPAEAEAGGEATQANVDVDDDEAPPRNGTPAATEGSAPDPAPGNPATMPPLTPAATPDETGEADERTRE